jgi:hypothetical protein
MNSGFIPRESWTGGGWVGKGVFFGGMLERRRSQPDAAKGEVSVSLSLSLSEESNQDSMIKSSRCCSLWLSVKSLDNDVERLPKSGVSGFIESEKKGSKHFSIGVYSSL